MTQTKAQDEAAYSIDTQLEQLLAEHGPAAVIAAIVRALYMSDLPDDSLEQLGNEIGRIPSMRLRT